MDEQCHGFWLLMDVSIGLITFESLKRNTILMGLHELRDDELVCMLAEGDLDGNEALNQMEFCLDRKSEWKRSLAFLIGTRFSQALDWPNSLFVLAIMILHPSSVSSLRVTVDQIEAPMWVDLTSECKSAYKDMDDEWFHICHPFHQASSRELKSAFSRSGESSINLEHAMQGSCSPKLPHSVSRSRGKDFRSRQWSQGDQRLTLDKKHPVKHLNNDKTRSISSSITSENGERCYKQELCVSDSSSTVTSEGCVQKSFEVSGPVLGQTTTGLLSTLRVSLRKSCVTRQASRIEVNVCRQSEGRKSSSSKSSVGSSSIPTERENKEKTPDSRNVTPIVEAKQANMSKVPVQARNRTSIPKMVTGRSISLSVPNGSNKANVHPNNVQRKALVRQRANQRVSSSLVKELEVASVKGL
ncbi:hypothetical protein RND71_034718 [Anisodus tanguticus]|uniref:EF-hand domain-containing protein n=1 Tax=Anisodus tanguticus TaxID=243964 RepID=A0AAE1UV67_9SOLA|nr:hypothetical protein RND71_034718 [Anisodus tanguticus]